MNSVECKSYENTRAIGGLAMLYNHFMIAAFIILSVIASIGTLYKWYLTRTLRESTSKLVVGTNRQKLTFEQHTWTGGSGTYHHLRTCS